MMEPAGMPSITIELYPKSTRKNSTNFLSSAGQQSDSDKCSDNKVSCLSVAVGQYDGPAPPRLSIPGAAPARGRPASPPVVQAPRRLALRGRAGAPRGRPQAVPALPPRPVIEIDDDSPTTYATPAFQPTTFQPPAFRPAPIADLPIPNRQQYNRGPPSEEAAFARGPRPSPLPQLEETDSGSSEDALYGTTRPRPTIQEDTAFTRSGEEGGFTRPRPVQQEQQQSFQRPAARPAIQQPDEQQAYQRASRPTQDHSYQRPRTQQVNEEQNLVRGRTELKSSYNRAQLQARPQKPQPQTLSENPSRQRKPTAQVISKYRNDNPDGSITWGFENDDGTFKEETIGIDCITKGKYGYIDPDGVRREYTYTSGIPCDKTSQDSEPGATNDGYIDYTNNKYVFPNGQEIDLDNMVKNRARRPSYRN